MLLPQYANDLICENVTQINYYGRELISVAQAQLCIPSSKHRQQIVSGIVSTDYRVTDMNMANY